MKLPEGLASEEAHSMLLARQHIKAVDVTTLESWNYDVFFYTQEELIAHTCVMFMQLGLTISEVPPRLPSRCVCVCERVCVCTSMRARTRKSFLRNQIEAFIYFELFLKEKGSRRN